jgi:hypothetical protein
MACSRRALTNSRSCHLANGSQRMTRGNPSRGSCFVAGPRAPCSPSIWLTWDHCIRQPSRCGHNSCQIVCAVFRNRDSLISSRSAVTAANPISSPAAVPGKYLGCPFKGSLNGSLGCTNENPHSRPKEALHGARAPGDIWLPCPGPGYPTKMACSNYMIWR